MNVRTLCLGVLSAGEACVVFIKKEKEGGVLSTKKKKHNP
jgi:hypothetical protein